MFRSFFRHLFPEHFFGLLLISCVLEPEIHVTCTVENKLCTICFFSPVLAVMSVAKEGFLILAAIIVISSSVVRLLMELFQVVQLRVWKYLLSWINWIEMILFLCSIMFVFVFANDCFCPT